MKYDLSISHSPNKERYITKGGNEQMLYTVKEVSELLKTNIDYVHKLRKAGLLPFLKIGQYKVRKEALENFLSQFEGKDITDPFYVREIILCQN